MSDKIKVREVVTSIFGIDEGSADHIMSIDKFLEKVNKLNENGYLSKNQGRIFINNREDCGNWDVWVGIDILREETDEEYNDRLACDSYEEDEEYKYLIHLMGKYGDRYNLEHPK